MNKLEIGKVYTYKIKPILDYLCVAADESGCHMMAALSVDKRDIDTEMGWAWPENFEVWELAGDQSHNVKLTSEYDERLDPRFGEFCNKEFETSNGEDVRRQTALTQVQRSAEVQANARGFVGTTQPSNLLSTRTGRMSCPTPNYEVLDEPKPGQVWEYETGSPSIILSTNRVWNIDAARISETSTVFMRRDRSLCWQCVDATQFRVGQKWRSVAGLEDTITSQVQADYWTRVHRVSPVLVELLYDPIMSTEPSEDFGDDIQDLPPQERESLDMIISQGVYAKLDVEPVDIGKLEQWQPDVADPSVDVSEITKLICGGK